MGTKEYHAQKSREWYQRQKEKAPEKLKARSDYAGRRRRENKSYWVKQFGSICAHCQVSFPDCVFEFHHTNHLEKDLQPSHMFHLSKEIQEKELKNV